MKLAAAALVALLGHHHCPPEPPSVQGGSPSFVRDEGVDMSALRPFCKRKPLAVACHGHQGHLLTLARVKEIDAAYRLVFQYRDDMLVHGIDDYYSNWTACGDCEDYALTLSELLALDGEDGRNMSLQFMIYCDDDGCDGHATLWVTTEAGVMEIDEDNAPARIKWNVWGTRQAIMPMDGTRRVLPLAGFGVNLHSLTTFKR